jgi:hypothetical protein
LITFSEQFDNAAWTKASATVTANTTTSPDGYVNADKIIPSVGVVGTIQQLHNISASQSCTMSIFAKADGLNTFKLNSRTADGFNDASISFNLSNGTISIAAASNGGYSAPSGTITNFGNGWYRLTLTHASSITTATRVRFFSEELGNGTDGVLIYGAQFETSAAYATSYIPTLGASVTRLADAASKTGISSLIGQTAGTIFFECSKKILESNATYLGISDGTGNNRINIYQVDANNLGVIVRDSSTTQANITNGALPADGAIKVAFAYANNDFVLYLNGTQVATDTSGSVPATSAFFMALNADLTPSSGNPAFNQAALFTTRLTNTQLATLTTL